MRRAVLSFVAVMSALAAGPAFAQRSSVVGVVRDSSGIPIPGAEVTAAASASRTDSLGRFYLSVPRADSISLVVRRMGFERVAFTISSAAAAENSIEVTMHALAVELAAVEVDAASLRARTVMEAFDRRRASGVGKFLTKEDIEKRSTQDLSNIVRGLPGVLIRRGRDGRGQLRFVQWQAKNCLPQFWVDGRVVRGFDIDDMPASHVEGIELYDGPASTPGEFRNAEFACGTVVIWSKVPILNRP